MLTYSPSFKSSFCISGIGYAMVTISTLVAIYYNVILAYTLYYLAQSFRSVLPWANCDEWWGADKETCFVRKKSKFIDNTLRV